MTLEINIEKAKKLGITIEEAAILIGLKEDIANKNFNILTEIEKTQDKAIQRPMYHALLRLEEKGFIKVAESTIMMLSKSSSLFEEVNINFNELFFAYPQCCPDRRGLRSVNKDTQDYKTCRSKYLRKVKTKEKHDKIVSIVKKYIEVIPKEKLNFLNGLEVFINQAGWEIMESTIIQQSNPVSSSRTIVER